MKRIIAISFGVLVLGAGFAQAQQWPVNQEAVTFLKEDLTRAGGNTNSYEFNPIVDTPAPAGYKAVYVSHYGRHGSRSNWGATDYQGVIDVLEAGQKEGILTQEGEALLGEARYVLEHYNGMDGRLTPRGVREHAKIAERLYHRVPSVFRGNGTVRSVSSTTPRCIISMCGFTNELARLNPKLEILPDTGEKIMAYINDPGTAVSIPAEIMEKLKAEKEGRVEDCEYVINHLFTDAQRGKALVGDVPAFHDKLFATAQIAEDFDLETNLYRHLPFDAIYKRWSYLNKYLYFHNGNSVENGDALMPASQTLVEDIVKKADEALASGYIVADLRFGHDYPLFNMVSYLGLDGVTERWSFDQIDYHWYGWRDLCMASNLQIIFYRNNKGNVLVKFLYQEKERLLRGLDPVQGPYYDWETVKADLKGYLR